MKNMVSRGRPAAFGVILTLAAFGLSLPTAISYAQDRRGGDRGAGPRRDAPPSRESGPARESGPSRDTSSPRIESRPSREAPPSRESSPPRVESRPSREAPPPRSDPRPSRDSYTAPPDSRPSRDYSPRVDRTSERSGDRSRPQIEAPNRGEDRPRTAPRRDESAGNRGAFDRGSRSDDGYMTRPPVRGSGDGRPGQETNGRAPDRTSAGYRSGDDRDRGALDRGPRSGGNRTDSRESWTDRRRDDRGPRLSSGEADRGRDNGRAPGVSVPSSRPYRDTARDIFTRSAEGRRYDRGIALRPATRYTQTQFRLYFPHGYCYYPHYSHTYVSLEVIASPYHFYYGVCPPYIHRRYVYHRPPRVVYIEIPVYVGDRYYGYGDGSYYLNSGGWWRDDRSFEPALRRAVEDLEDAFRYSDINRLVYLTDAGADIAVFSRGKYEYSLSANDYLDMTRDFMVGADTVWFDVFRVRRRSADVCNLSAKHVYRARDGETRVVYLSFVLERIRDDWVITQVDTAPDRL